MPERSRSTSPARCGPRATARMASCCRRVGATATAARSTTARPADIVTPGDGSIGLIAQSIGGGGGFAADVLRPAPAVRATRARSAFELNGSIFDAGRRLPRRAAAERRRRRCGADQLCSDGRRHDRRRRRHRRSLRRALAAAAVCRWRVRQSAARVMPARSRSISRPIRPPATARTAHCCKASAAATAACRLRPGRQHRRHWAPIRSALSRKASAAAGPR